MQSEFIIQTNGQGLYEFTREAERFVAGAGIETGVLTVFVRHTSCSMLIQENADPDVQRDLHGFFDRIVPEDMEWLRDTQEGPDDMPAHIKAAMTQVSLSIPVSGNAMLLGTWQGIYLFEHRHAPHSRKVVLHMSP